MYTYIYMETGSSTILYLWVSWVVTIGQPNIMTTCGPFWALNSDPCEFLYKKGYRKNPGWAHDFVLKLPWETPYTFSDSHLRRIDVEFGCPFLLQVWGCGHLDTTLILFLDRWQGQLRHQNNTRALHQNVMTLLSPSIFWTSIEAPFVVPDRQGHELIGKLCVWLRVALANCRFCPLFCTMFKGWTSGLLWESQLTPGLLKAMKFLKCNWTLLQSTKRGEAIGKDRNVGTQGCWETWKAKPVNDMLVTYGDPLFVVSPLGGILWSLGPSPKQIALVEPSLSCRPQLAYINWRNASERFLLNARCYKQCFAVCMCCISLRLWKAVHVASGCQAMERKFNVTAMLVC